MGRRNELLTASEPFLKLQDQFPEVLRILWSGLNSLRENLIHRYNVLYKAFSTGGQEDIHSLQSAYKESITTYVQLQNVAVTDLVGYKLVDLQAHVEKGSVRDDFDTRSD